MFNKLKKKSKDYIVKDLNDDFFQTTINVKRPIDFGLELDSFFCYLEQEERDPNISIVSIIPIEKETYLVTFKQN